MKGFIASLLLFLGACHCAAQDEEYNRWEVVNSVRPGDGGFSSGVRGDGIERFTEPGLNATVNLTYRF